MVGFREICRMMNIRGKDASISAKSNEESKEINRRKYFKPVELPGEQKKMRTFYQGKDSTKHENNGISPPYNKDVNGQTAKHFSATYYKAYDEDAGSSNSKDEEEFRGPPCKKKKPNEEKLSSSNIEYAKESKFSNEQEHVDIFTKLIVKKGGITEKNVVLNKGFCSTSEETEQQVNDKGPCRTKGHHRYQKPFDDTLTTSVVKKLGKKSDSVGVLISFGRIVGTVFCAGEKYVLTASHVIQTIPEKGRYRNSNTFVNFNDSPLTPVKEVFQLEKMAFSDNNLDVVVLEVSNPEGLPKAMKLNKQDHDKQNITKVSVIGFGHTSHQMKTLDPGCSLIAPDSLRIQCTQIWIREKNEYYKRALNDSGHSHIVDNELGVFNDFNFIMESFMEQGVSGAPAIAAFGDDSLNVTGLVTHGTPEFYHLLHTFFKSDNFPFEHRYTMGTKMKDIFLSIGEKDPQLARALFC